MKTSFILSALPALLPFVNAGGAFESCSGWSQDITIVQANCKDANGNSVLTKLDLNSCFANDNGRVVVSFIASLLEQERF
jgi:hypothetical protein